LDALGTIYRYDNVPDKKWKSIVAAYPYHFHNGSQDNVVSSPFPLEIINGFRAFMKFIKKNKEIYY
jgi:hypothetical protein